MIGYDFLDNGHLLVDLYAKTAYRFDDRMPSGTLASEFVLSHAREGRIDCGDALIFSRLDVGVGLELRGAGTAYARLADIRGAIHARSQHISDEPFEYLFHEVRPPLVGGVTQALLDALGKEADEASRRYRDVRAKAEAILAEAWEVE